MHAWYKGNKGRIIAICDRIFQVRFLAAAFVLALVFWWVQYAVVGDARLDIANRTLSCDQPLEIARMSDGSAIVNDASLRIMCITPQGTLRWHIDAAQDTQLTGMTLDENDQLYVYLTVNNKSGAVRDEIRQYDVNGRLVRTLYTMDYTAEKADTETTVRTSPLRAEGGTLYFTRYLVYETQLYQTDLASAQTHEVGKIESDIPFLYNDVEGYADGVYYYAKITGELGRGTVNGPQTVLYQGDYRVRSSDGFRPFYIRSADGKLFVFDYWQGKIYQVEDGALAEPQWQGGVSYEQSAYEFCTSGDTLLGISDGIPWYVEDGCVYELPSSARISLGMALAEGVLRLASAGALCLCCLFSAFLCVGIIWRILVQGRHVAGKIVLLEAMICAGLLMLLYGGVSAEYKNYVVQDGQSLGDKAGLTAQLVDGDALAALNTSRQLDAQAYTELSRLMIENYGLYETATDTAATVLIPDDEGNYIIVASNRGYGDIFGDSRVLEAALGNSAPVGGIGYINAWKTVVAYQAVKDDAGVQTGYVCLYKEVRSAQARFASLWPPYVLAGYFGLIGLLFITFVLIFTRRLRKITVGVQKISSGNFNERIESHTQDELGDLIRCVNEMSGSIEQLVSEKVELSAQINRSQYEALEALASIVENKSGQTAAHVARVSKCVRLLASRMGYRGEQLEYITIASMLHDVGKLFVPAEILEKPGKLTAEEFEIVKRHVTDGEALLHGVSGPIMEYARNIALEHHEKWDGSGYMMGKKGEEISLEARITAVADVFDALISKRPYKPPYPAEKVYAIILEESGKHFDPQVVAVFAECFAQLCEIIRQNPDKDAA